MHTSYIIIPSFTSFTYRGRDHSLSRASLAHIFCFYTYSSIASRNVLLTWPLYGIDLINLYSAFALFFTPIENVINTYVYYYRYFRYRGWQSSEWLKCYTKAALKLRLFEFTFVQDSKESGILSESQSSWCCPAEAPTVFLGW